MNKNSITSFKNYFNFRKKSMKQIKFDKIKYSAIIYLTNIFIKIRKYFFL